MKFKFSITKEDSSKVTVSRNKRKPSLIAKVTSRDTVTTTTNEYEIAKESKSINGFKDFYDGNTRIILTRPYKGENENYRPYKIGTTVSGKIHDGKFHIDKIKHGIKTRKRLSSDE